uniref:Cas12f1-like TNB domain-containing protein n=1 Tax=viral metagenome TaxID=1070528 RepID=A0A6C0JNP6_9ZZZZ
MEKEKPPDDFFKGIKISLKSVLKHPDINTPKITNAVIKCNKIVIQVLMFMKLFLLDHYDKHNKLPTINDEFINSCMKILCNEKASGRPPKKEIKELKDTLTTFYKSDFQPLIQNEDLDYTHMNTILDYLTIDILTMYENNIKFHYVEYVERYVNVVWKKKFIVSKIRKLNITQKAKEQRINNLCNQLRKIKTDLLNIENVNYKSYSMYHKWINQQKQIITPNKQSYKKNNIVYDLMCSPFEYFSCMIFMMKQIEKEEQTIYNVFPMRSEVIPKHIRLDTTTLVHLLMTKKQGNKSDFLTKGNLKRKEDKIWEFFFRTERKMFHKKYYEFHHMIETDGVSCSLLLLRKDLIGKKLPMMKKGLSTETYIDEVNDYSQIQNKKIVAIDPGKCDLIYCLDDYNKEANKFRYSQDQRRKETKKKKYSKIQLELKKEKIHGKTIIEWETELSKLNRKSLNISKFKEYIQKKSEINGMLFSFYEKYIFRKLRLQSYRNTKRSEQKMINQFKKIFGNEKEVVVCFGDYEQKQHMKFKEATKGKGMRTLFRKAGFQTYLVDEFRTSCMCSNCEIGICKKTMVRKNPKPYRNGNIIVHGLICCKNGCGYWNRDVNGATNIYKIAYNAINNKERPNYLSRSKNLSTGLDEPVKPKFTRSVKGKPC